MKTINFFNSFRRSNSFIISMVVLLSASMLSLTSCEKDEEEEEAPELFFKTSSAYTATDVTVSPGDEVTIGIEAEVREAKDPIVKFNISKSVNGAAATSVYNEDLSTDAFEYDYFFTVDSTQSGNTEKFTFTVTNRDGLTGQKSLTLTIE